ncbi:family 43 glycosylhydrolase [Opitutus terrae]|uniref:Glycoside hydrolase family 43 n=1 Tax=Opitutus terrae (strain DSM 11246 / JCM 15787 / PB90-1) TaxID=452637 RepID=B1ZPL7_OPITP|nr:family 43 glycosylhydrolase [Opitutus terrae]ACB74536.1 glycoside hydrolase family 43 [Opitutus terrae PB90-1]
MRPLLALVTCMFALSASAATWTADNGNGTFTNPLFYDEFSDPDLIRVGDDFYLTGTTMHAQPGLPILHSRDLVNWQLLTYAFERLDLGPAFRLEEGRESYGQGIWAPCFRHHGGTFYIFSNVNGQTTQLFRAQNPAGPWTRTPMKRAFHDLSVLFDDDGKVYVIWGYQDVHFAQLDEALTDIVPGTEKIIIRKGAGLGEGLHWYKIDGRYYILSAWFEGRMRMPAARADRPDGPYEINPAISMDEDFGLAEGYRLRNRSFPFEITPPNTRDGGRMSLHQGGIVSTPAGEWWGFSMMDYNSVGRLTCLSPVTWQDGWPYFGLPGNLKRTPRTWIKPATAHTSAPAVPYQRDDDFSGPKLANVWQWNHVPIDDRWSLAERAGYLRLHALPAPDFWWARNTLTQRAIGPQSVPTVALDVSGLKAGDVAGLALLNLPYAWLGVRSDGARRELVQFDQLTGKSVTVPLERDRVWLRASCDFLTEQAVFSYSVDGSAFTRIGDEFTMIFQLKTFQGVRYALFAYNTSGATGGHADFDRFTVDEPHPRGLMRPIPASRTITLTPVGVETAVAIDGANRFEVVARELGRVALRAGERYVSVNADGQLTLKKGEPADSELFQWTENVYGDLNLLSLTTHRHVRFDAARGLVFADSPGPKPDRHDGSCLVWRYAE